MGYIQEIDQPANRVIHDSNSCRCSMCRWADDYEQRQQTPTPPPTEFQLINQRWVEACEAAAAKCPLQFQQELMSLIFLGQSLMSETRITAEINTAKETINAL